MRKILLLLLLFFLEGACSYAQDSLRIAREVGLARANVARNPDSCLIYAQNVIRWASKNGNDYQLGQGFALKGSCFQSAAQSDSAIKYYESALVLFKKGNFQHELEATNANVGMIFEKMGNEDKSLGNFERSRTNLMKAVEYYQTSDYTKGLGKVYYSLGALEDTLNRTLSAIANYKKSIGESQKNGDMLLEILATQKLATDYAFTDEYHSAFEAQAQLHGLIKKLLDQEKQKQAAELEAKFESLQKEKEIEEQKNRTTIGESRQPRTRQYLYGSLGLLVIGTLLFLYLRARGKIRAMRVQELHEKLVQQERLMAVIDSQEQERKRFTSDLHDSFGQLISVLYMNISELADAAAAGSIGKMEKFQECKNLINEMFRELRNVVFDIMPQTLVTGGIKPTLRELSDRLNRSGRIFSDVQFHGLEKRLPEAIETALYRVSQEWINNVLKHSAATKITIRLTEDDEEITLIIEDNGTGFDRRKLLTSKGNGWKNINSRVALIGGNVGVETTSGQKGTIFTLQFPQLKGNTNEQKIPA